MSKYKYNAITGKLDLTDDFSEEDRDALSTLNDAYLNFNNITVFDNTNAVIIDYSDMPLTPNIEVFVTDNQNNAHIAYPKMDYDFDNKKVTLYFNNNNESGFIILT